MTIRNVCMQLLVYYQIGVLVYDNFNSFSLGTNKGISGRFVTIPEYLYGKSLVA